MMGKQVIYHVTPKEYLLWALSGEEIVCQDCDGLGYNRPGRQILRALPDM